MNAGFLAADLLLPLGNMATHPIAPLAVLLLLVGGHPTASSRLAIQPASCTLGHVQPPLLGLKAKTDGKLLIVPATFS